MATIGQVENRIYLVEGFRVEIEDLYGRNIRSDMHDMKPYKQARAMPDRNTVNDWKDKRFRERYGNGFKVRVLKPDRTTASGGMLLGTLRDEYGER